VKLEVIGAGQPAGKKVKKKNKREGKGIRRKKR